MFAQGRFRRRFVIQRELAQFFPHVPFLPPALVAELRVRKEFH